MDLTGAAMAIDMIARPVTLSRPAVGSYVDGRWVEAASGTSTIMAAILAISPRDMANLRNLMDLPEGQSTRATRSIWSRTPLFNADEASGRRPDEIVDGGVRYRVVAVFDRIEGGYYKAALERVVDRGRTV